jgi:hypothetical protein
VLTIFGLAEAPDTKTCIALILGALFAKFGLAAVYLVVASAPEVTEDSANFTGQEHRYLRREVS